MKKEIKAAVFDVDGTLYDYKNHCVPDSAIKAVHMLKNRGILIMIASGRTKAMLSQEIMEQISPDYYVLSNGAFVTDCHDLNIHKNTFTFDEIEYMVNLTNKYNGAMILKYNRKNCIYFDYQKGRSLWDVGPGLAPGTIYFDEERSYHKKELPLGVTISGNSRLKQSIEESFSILPFRDNNEFDVLRTGMHKMSGLNILLDKLELKAKDIIAFGDAGNDVEMITAAGIGVAMGNGQQELKEAADFVAPCSWEDGIYKSLKQLQFI